MFVDIFRRATRTFALEFPFMEKFEWFNKLLFPAFPSSYVPSNIPELLYLPRNLKQLQDLRSHPHSATIRCTV